MCEIPVSIIIPSKNEEKNIKRLLESIKKQDVQPKEVILADNQSEDKTVEIALSYGVKVVKGGLPAVARNAGARATTQDILIFMDADSAFLDSSNLSRIYEKFLKSGKDSASCWFKSIVEKKTLDDLLSQWALNIVKLVASNSILDAIYGDMGGFFIIKKNAFDSVGGFNENFQYGEDSMLFLILKKAGFKHTVLNEKIGLVTSKSHRAGKNTADLKYIKSAILGLFARDAYMKENYEKAYRISAEAKQLYPLGGISKYENPYKPKDRESGYPKGTNHFQKRIYEIIPGILFWFFLLIPIIFAIFKWELPFVIYVSFLVAYWSIRTFKFVIGVWVGIRRMRRDLSTDWIGKIRKEKALEFEKLNFVYICPVYAESLDVLEPTIESFAINDVGAKKIDVVFAMEEKKADFQIENFKHLKEKFGKRFKSMRYYIHPAGIPGEIAGVKGGNINWATRHYVKDLQDEGIDIHDYLLITCDSDLRPHPKYLSAIAYKYLTIEEPDMRYYATAIHTFNNNIWRVPRLIRAQSHMLTLVLLQNWVFDKKKVIPFSGEEIYVRDSFSSYVVNLKTLSDIEFWDPEIANDDTAFYWNAMVRTKGKFKSEEVYIPTDNDAVENETMIKSYVSYYKQQHRWGWGAINVPITLAALIKDSNKDFPWYRKLFMWNMLFEYQIWYLTVVFVLTFGLNIMGWLNPSYQFTIYSYSLPQLLTYIFTVITLLNIPLIIFRRQITPIPHGWKWWQHVLDIVETFLVTVNMLTFGFIPYLQAKTEMMLGQTKFKRNFYVTEKVRIS